MAGFGITGFNQPTIMQSRLRAFGINSFLYVLIMHYLQPAAISFILLSLAYDSTFTIH
jgi:uncharacterized membrane protein